MMSWTKKEITEFDKLIEDVSSQDQLSRIRGRLQMQHFVNTHGKDKCDEMWNHLENGGKKVGKK